MTDIIKNEIEARLYDEDWPVPAILVFSMLLGISPNSYGVYHYPGGKVQRFFSGIFSPDAAIGELESRDLIRFYKDRRVIWIVGKWGKDRYSSHPLNQLGAHNYVVEHYPDVYPDFLEKYPVLGGSSPKAKKQRSQKRKIDPVASGWGHGVAIKLFPRAKNHNAQATILDRIDKDPGELEPAEYSREKLEKVLAWALEDKFWGGKNNFGSCANLRNRRVKGDVMKFEKIWAAYDRFQGLFQGKPPGGKAF